MWKTLFFLSLIWTPSYCQFAQFQNQNQNAFQTLAPLFPFDLLTRLLPDNSNTNNNNFNANNNFVGPTNNQNLDLGRDPERQRIFNCQCSDLMWSRENGVIVGRCLSADLDGLPICYLHVPNNCRDAAESIKFPGITVSKIGCGCALDEGGFCRPVQNRNRRSVEDSPDSQPEELKLNDFGHEMKKPVNNSDYVEGQSASQSASSVLSEIDKLNGEIISNSIGNSDEKEIAPPIQPTKIHYVRTSGHSSNELGNQNWIQEIFDEKEIDVNSVIDHEDENIYANVLNPDIEHLDNEAESESIVVEEEVTASGSPMDGNAAEDQSPNGNSVYLNVGNPEHPDVVEEELHQVPSGFQVDDGRNKVNISGKDQDEKEGEGQIKNEPHLDTNREQQGDFTNSWCQLSPICCTGRSQSPIDIVTSDLLINNNLSVKSKEEEEDIFGMMWRKNLNFPFLLGSRYPLTYSGAYTNTQSGTISNKNGTYVQFDIESMDDLILSGGILGRNNYRLLQLHFHLDSEHTVDQKSYDGEVHLVHQNIWDENDLTVIGFLFEESDNYPKSTWLQKIVDDLNGSSAPLTDPNDKVDTFQINIGQLFVEAPSLSDYAYYQGSLTTPGCTEVVNWIVMLQPVKINESQLSLFQNIKNLSGEKLVKNNRPTQPLFDRKVWRSNEDI